MKIIALPDIHGDITKIKQLKEPLSQVDLVLLVGDITNFGHKTQMKQMIDLVMNYNSQCLTVPGNCDYPDSETTLNETETNINGLNKSINGLIFAGLGASLPTPANGTPFEVSESYFSERLQSAAKNLDIKLPLVFVSHQPPYDTKTDRLSNGIHVGSKEVRKFIEQHQPLICFTGHIHEGQGIDKIGKTQVINPGPVYRGYYAYAEINQDVELLEIRNI